MTRRAINSGLVVSGRCGWLAVVVGLSVAAASCAGAAARLATEADVTALEPAARAGDRAAIRALFELSILPGATALQREMALGATIRRCPHTLLQELARELALVPERRLDSLLACDLDLVDDFPAQRREQGARASALLTVTDPALVPVRDRCVARLRALSAALPD